MSPELLQKSPSATSSITFQTLSYSLPPINSDFSILLSTQQAEKTSRPYLPAAGRRAHVLGSIISYIARIVNNFINKQTKYGSVILRLSADRQAHWAFSMKRSRNLEYF
jgi:hypothetical protein